VEWNGTLLFYVVVLALPQGQWRWLSKQTGEKGKILWSICFTQSKLLGGDGNTEWMAPCKRISVYVSYGGLLQKIVGDTQSLKDFEMDATIYCLMRRLQ